MTSLSNGCLRAAKRLMDGVVWLRSMGKTPKAPRVRLLDVSSR